MFTTVFNENALQRFFRSQSTSDARICVVGIGGGGGNAINNMVRKGITGVDFIAVNTDSQVLASNKAGRRIQAGKEATGGLGAGARPEVGADAVEESHEEIKRALEPYDMAFVTAGMGGGTGTGGAPVVASMAREMGILTVGIVTRPFACESPHRMQAAEQGIAELRDHVDTLLVIPNERLLDLASERTSLVEAFRMADEVLYDATRGISDLITREGLVNLDFADVETTMKDGGTALLGMSSELTLRQHDGPRVRGGSPHSDVQGHTPSDTSRSRAEKAAIEAISSPLFDGRSIRGANKVVVNVTGGPSLSLREAMAATEVIQDEAGDACEVIFGAVIDEEMEGRFQVTVIATGLDEQPGGAKPSDKRAVRISADELKDRKTAASGDGASGDGTSEPPVLRETQA
jgi:cell division protein FtsZ